MKTLPIRVLTFYAVFFYEITMDIIYGLYGFLLLRIYGIKRHIDVAFHHSEVIGRRMEQLVEDAR